MFTADSEDDVREYARSVFRSYRRDDAGGIRRGLVRPFIASFYLEHDRPPTAADFADHLADRYAETVADPREGIPYADRIDALDRIDAARRAGKICPDCLGDRTYGDWIGDGAETGDDGEPVRTTDVTVRPRSIPRRFRARIDPRARHTVEVAYVCPTGEHGTGFVERHFLTDEEFAEFRRERVDAAARLKDALDLDDEG